MKILLGITDPDVPYVVSSDGKIVAFVQADELWNYDKEQDQLSLLFSFRDAENADVRNKVSDHKIQILNMDKKGNTTFSVSGYMNRAKRGYVRTAANTKDIWELPFITIISRPTVLKKRHSYPATNQLQSQEVNWIR